MNVGDDKGKVVTEIIAEVKPAVMVEVGAYVGYSAILFADASRRAGGKGYYCLEHNPEFAAVVASLVDLAGLSDYVKVIVGSAEDSFTRLKKEGVLTHIDLLFLDHLKELYGPDLRLAEELALVGKGTVLCADNVIWPGAPGYLEYVRSSNQEKREAAPGRSKEQRKGNPNLIYKSELKESFEPTGERVRMTTALSIQFASLTNNPGSGRNRGHKVPGRRSCVIGRVQKGPAIEGGISRVCQKKALLASNLKRYHSPISNTRLHSV
jgi:catechol O-methyltransferase